ncbi:MAG: Cys-tRNA(Pro) deacylase [Bifidobacteriaceae bacterium]|nr:Cys-tRNA(Pro) deacylase [Bifidobacteriaceae bacterium]
MAEDWTHPLRAGGVGSGSGADAGPGASSGAGSSTTSAGSSTTSASSSTTSAGSKAAARKAGPTTPGRKATPALTLLEQAGVEYLLETFDSGRVSTALGEGYGLAAARALQVDPDTVFKTLMVKVDGDLWCAVIPVTRHLDLKAVARAAGGKRAGLAAVTEAERATGYAVGGISPLGQRAKHPTLIDSSAQALDQMLVSAGGRGMDVKLAPGDLARLVEATFVPIGRL